jgi:hypothetical protein
MMRISTNQTALRMCCVLRFTRPIANNRYNPMCHGLGEGCNLQSEHFVLSTSNGFINHVMSAERAHSALSDIDIIPNPVTLSQPCSLVHAAINRMSAVTFVTFTRPVRAQCLNISCQVDTASRYP